MTDIAQKPETNRPVQPWQPPDALARLAAEYGPLKFQLEIWRDDLDAYKKRCDELKARVAVLEEQLKTERATNAGKKGIRGR
jgi:hypothetical protein